ncbi:hypothetical protein F5B19DRAFT_490436 [Rostrohypoxylon terebratum]|nr:hypothetical protein F5B19DRAFT_490436 [Rostrohypoxylon terebratum]
MAGYPKIINLDELHGTHRPHAPIGPVGPGSRPHDTQLPSEQPVDVVRGRSIEISDVSGDLRTVNDMREDLTEYTIFRFEKMPAQNQYDDEGKPQLPTWDRALRVRVPGISPREIIREIQHLNRNTRNLSDKLKSLSPVLQRQVDKAQEDLALENPDPINYHWVLVQLDHQLREIGPYFMIASRRHSTHRARYGPTRRRSYGRSSNRHERKSYERISLRAFFKRTPRPNADIAMLWEAKNLRSNQVVRPHSQPHPYQRSPQNPQQPHVNQQPQSQPGLGSDPRAQQPGTNPGIRTPVQPNGVRGPPAATPYPNKPGLLHGVNLVSNAANGSTHISRGREGEPTTSHGNRIDIESESDYSNYLSMDESTDSPMTPDTSQPGSPGNDIGHARVGGGGRVRASNKSTRYDGGIPDRPTSRSQQNLNVNSSPGIQPATVQGPRRSAPRHLASPQQVDIGRVREEAYLAGIRRGRDEKKVSRERAYREGRRPRSKPRIFLGARSPSPPHRRHIPRPDPERLRHIVELDEGVTRFNRLSLDEEDDRDHVPRRADARQQREFEYLMHQGSVLEDDPFDCERPPHTRYGRRRHQETYMSDDSESDLSLPERSTNNRWSGY